MNNEDVYVASGVLELYAAGALNEEERLDVEQMAATSPAIRAALDEACAVMEQYAALHAVQPSPALKARVLDQITPHTPAAQNFQTTSYQLQQQEQVLRVLRDENFQSVRLQRVEAHPEANVLVYWNPEQREVYVDAVQLPAPPAGKQYQLWALLDGKPIDAGLINMENNQLTMQQMKEIGAAQAFAVTLEPAGGSVNPTLEQLYVMGEVDS